MDTAERIAFLDELIERAESDQTRLRAIELREQIGERQARTPTPPQPVDDSVEKIERTFELAVEFGLFDCLPAFEELVQRKAEELIAVERAELRKAVRRVNRTAADEPEAGTTKNTDEALAEAQEPVDAPRAGTTEPASEPTEEPSDPHSPEILERQWGRHRPRGLRNVRPSATLGRKKYE